MRVIREVEAGGRKVQVKELTLGEVRAMVKQAESAPAQASPNDVLDAYLFEECGLPELYAMSDLTSESVAALLPSEIKRVIDEAKELNGAFFSMRERLQRTLDQLGEALSPKP